MSYPLRTATVILIVGLAAAGLRAVDADPSWGKAADNKIYAQTLVNDVMANHPELVVFGVHATAPGSKDEALIACNLDRIGKKDDDDDIAVATEGKMIMAPNLKDPNKFEVQLPLLDVQGRVVGSTGFVFKYHAGQDVVKLLKRALSIREDLAKKISDQKTLFQTAP